MYCNHCEKDMPNDFKFCPVCGSPPPPQPHAYPNNPPPPQQSNYYQSNYYQNTPNFYKSESTTLILAIILGLLGIQGVGHMYVGKIGKGVGILIGSIILAVIGYSFLIAGFALYPLLAIGIIILIGYFIMFIWQIINSRNLCLEYNDYISRNGKPPW